MPGERRRTFTDADGVYWDVREAKAPDYDRRGGLCLIFEATGVIRRVRNFPENWLDISDVALADVSCGT